jgi:hypothetical protein
VCLGQATKKVTILPDGDSLGHHAGYRRRSFWQRVEEADYDCTYGRSIDGRLRRAIEADIMIALAGGFTAMMAFGKEEHEVGMGSQKLSPAAAAAMAKKHGGEAGDYETMILGGDYHAAFELVDKVSGGEEEASAYLEWLICRTRNLLRMPGFVENVVAVAEALCDKDTLTGVEVLQVIEEAKEKRWRQQLASDDGKRLARVFGLK